MKRAYLANGTLATPAKTTDNILALDAATWGYLNTLLAGDYCYLIVGKQEVVKIQSLEAPNIALVIRGASGSDRVAWAAGTSIAYGVSSAEIQDAVDYVGAQLTVQYPLQYMNGVLFYTELDIVGLGGCTVDGSDEGLWMIQDISGNAGCNNPLSPSLPPPIPLNYYKLRIVTEGYYRQTIDGSYREYI